MKWVKEDIKEVLEQLNTDVAGLSEQEVISRQQKYGLNEFEEEKKEGIFRKILHHLSEIPTLILIAASIVATIAAVLNENPELNVSSWAKVIVILSIVVINVILGLYQESKAEKALEALKKMNAFKTTVIRGGVKMVVEASQLVPGDIVELNAGDVVTADARLIEASSLQIEEAALTGESVPVEKDPGIVITDTVPLGDRLNMVYSGCLVTNGRAIAVVVATAMETEMGKIARLLNTTQKMLTPLQLRLKQLAKRLSVIALLAGVAMFAAGFFMWGMGALEMLLLAVALGVAAVPETLPIIVTMILSYGVFNMVTKRAIIRKIPAIETVGNTSVICSDKTGTLTLNKMKIQRVWHAEREPASVQDELHDDERHIVELLAACSNATIENYGTEEESVLGDPTEIAMVRLLHGIGLTRADIETKYPRVHELPFDSGRKRMTTVHQVPDGYLVVTKGAFDRIPVIWESELQKKADKIHDSFAEKALRVIAVGYKKYAEMPKDLSEDALERDLTFLGMVGMIDPPRPESKDAVARAKEAGIKTVMITGDHIETAKAIAKEIGIFNDGDRAVTGTELAEMSETDLISIVRGITVYARVSPEDKLRIVAAWQHHNAVVAMTGDGVNDAPALKAADVGAAMGITGTEVSKNAADMIITDDNFATIVDAISEGRTSYDNIRKTIQFLLGVNFAEIFVLLVGMLVLGRTTVTALQILIVNVVYDGIPGFFLAFEKPEPGVMKRKPLPKGSGVFAQRVGFFIAWRAVLFSILIMSAFLVGSFVQIHPGFIVPWGGAMIDGISEAGMSVTEIYRAVQACEYLSGVTFYYALENSGMSFIRVLRYGGNFGIGMTMAFMVLSWASVIDIFNTRTTLSIFKAGLLTNKGIFFTVVFSIIFSLIVALWPPLMNIFGVVHISIWHWAIIAGLALSHIAAVEMIKLVLRIRDKKRAQTAAA